MSGAILPLRPHFMAWAETTLLYLLRHFFWSPTRFLVCCTTWIIFSFILLVKYRDLTVWYRRSVEHVRNISDSNIYSYPLVCECTWVCERKVRKSRQCLEWAVLSTSWQTLYIVLPTSPKQPMPHASWTRYILQFVAAYLFRKEEAGNWKLRSTLFS
jgi:hypothetical protein